MRAEPAARPKPATVGRAVRIALLVVVVAGVVLLVRFALFTAHASVGVRGDNATASCSAVGVRDIDGDDSAFADHAAHVCVVRARMAAFLGLYLLVASVWTWQALESRPNPSPTGLPRRRNRRVLGVAVLALASGVTLSVLVVSRTGSSPAAGLASFLRTWQAADFTAMQRWTTEPGGDLRDLYADIYDTLGVTETRFDVGRIPTAEGDASVGVTLTLGGLGEWTYSTDVPMRGARVEWSPAVLHPRLDEGLRLALDRQWPRRAPVLGANDVPLTLEGSVVRVGLEPQRIKDRDQTLAAVEEHLGLDPADVARRLDGPGVQPDWFIPLVELREEPYAEMRPSLAPIPGVVFRREPARVTPTEEFAWHVVGRMGEITAEQLRELGPPYREGDVVGRSGLELVFERQLAGTPEATVRLDGGDGGDGDEARALHTFEATPPQPVRTTIARSAQAAADEALDGVDRPAALVAVDASTGEIRAVSSRPLDESFNRALAGRYPPGSTFKIVTAAALLARGADPVGNVSCPREVEVGRPFRNAEGRALGTITFREAFVRSCNTAFVGLSRTLEDAELVRSAGSFGFEAEYELPLPVAGGRFPAPGDETERAAAAIGQGRVEASPLHMATVAAAVADGAWHQPVLLRDRTVQDFQAVDARAVVTLREWMHGVVADGTGTLAAVPGQTVAGKTGTAEFGEGDPPPAHAWFVGFRGGLAFAVLVEEGGSGGEVAAPIAARFLTELG